MDGLLQQGPGHPHRGSHQDVLHEEHASAGPQHGILDVCHGQFEILTICVLKVPDLVTSVFELVKVTAEVIPRPPNTMAWGDVDAGGLLS